MIRNPLNFDISVSLPKIKIEENQVNYVTLTVIIYLDVGKQIRRKLQSFGSTILFGKGFGK